MKYIPLFFSILLTSVSAAFGQKGENPGSWEKYAGNPILGQNYETVFDVSVLKNDNGTFQMFCSYYELKVGVALSESKDGLNWSTPDVVFRAQCTNDNLGWEKFINRPSVIKKDGKYLMWYSGQDAVSSHIGYAVSDDGRNWTKYDGNPVLSPDQPWEKEAVMNPNVIWDEQEQIFKMWYSAGGYVEPAAIGYATSKDGIRWEKDRRNPVFTANAQAVWEKAKVGGCQVIRRKSDYLMFYVGYSDNDHAQIGMARSKDGVTHWERYTGNPVLKPGSGWDCDAVYKPYAVADKANNRWLLYYNARRNWHEQIGVAIRQGMDLGF